MSRVTLGRGTSGSRPAPEQARKHTSGDRMSQGAIAPTVKAFTYLSEEIAALPT